MCNCKSLKIHNVTNICGINKDMLCYSMLFYLTDKCLWILRQTCSSEFLLSSSSSSSSAGCDAMKPADISDALKDSLASL